MEICEQKKLHVESLISYCRTQSVKNVRQTNGRISLEKRAQLWDEDDWSDDEWQS